MSDSLNLLRTRRSTALKDLTVPAPEGEVLHTLLTIATRVPDHGKLCPWRLVLIREAAALKLGELAAARLAALQPEASEAELAYEQSRFIRAPLCIAVLSTPVADRKPVWEQELSAGAVCMNLLLAAEALGFGAKWLTEWVAYDEALRAAIGGGPADKIAGFIYLGTKTAATPDRERPTLADVVRELYSLS